MEISVVPSKPKRYYLPLSLSFDDAECRCKRWLYSIRQQLQESNIVDLRYFDAELFAHTATIYSTMQHTNLLSKKKVSLSCPKIISDSNRLKQVESIPKQAMPQQLSKLFQSLTLAPINGEQIFQKCCHERSKNMKSKKIPKIFLATKHISLLSSRHETDNNIETDFVDTNYNRNHNMDSEVKPSAIGYSNRFTEQRLKTTLVASAEKMKHAFCRNVKVIETPTMLKNHKCIQRLQHPVNYLTDEDSDVSYV